MTKECRGCGETLPRSDFYIRANGWASPKCKPCTRAERRKNHDPEKKKDYDLKRLYGIGLEEYNDMLNAQDGGCFICGKQEDTLCVDHDHDTGEVRGLLCHSCNRGIGLLGDSSDTLIRAAEYLQGYGK